MRRVCAALGVLAALGSVSRAALASLAAGPELDVGVLHAGPTTFLPGAALVADETGIVASYLDKRSYGNDDSVLFAQHLGVDGSLGSEMLVATEVHQHALFATPFGALALFTQRSSEGGPLLGAFLTADGGVEGPSEFTGLLSFPESLACVDTVCIAAVVTGFQRLDLTSKTASAAFKVPAVDTVGPAGTFTATLGLDVVAISTGSSGNDRFLLSAELDLAGGFLRPFESEGVATALLSRLDLLAGSDGYLAAMSLSDPNTTTVRSLRLVTLDAQGHVAGSSTDVPLEPANSWKGAWAKGAYRLVLGGNQLSTVAVADSAAVVTPYPLNPVPYTTVTGAVADASADSGGLVASLAVGSSGPDATLSNLVRVGPDGGFQNLPLLGVRPSQQLMPMVAARGDRYLVAYQENEADGTRVRYSFLDAAGHEVGIAGSVELTPVPNTDTGWVLQAADEGFWLGRSEGAALIDDAGGATPVALALPEDASRRQTTTALGGGVVLAVSQHYGMCGEDCAWADIGAQRFGLDGSALDPAPLFGPPPDFRGQASRYDPRAVWDGKQFVVSALGDTLEFTRVGADGSLLDAGWLSLAPADDRVSVTSRAMGTGGGTTLVVWTTFNQLRGVRIFPDGTIDAAPIDLAGFGALPTVGSSAIPVENVPCDVAYDGARFVVAWLADGAEHAVTLSNDGTVGPAVALTSPGIASPPHAPSLASPGDGRLLLAYDRFDTAPAAFTSRVKLRTLAEGLAELGSECGADAECSSSFCVGGLCCNERCDGIGMSCSGAVTGAPDGVCGEPAPVEPDAGAPVEPVLSCDVPNACPPDFTCDAVKLVCIPPVLAPSPPTESGGCGCRVSTRARATRSLLWILVAFLAPWLRGRARHRAAPRRDR